jgi:ELWxxDGT repeat protein
MNTLYRAALLGASLLSLCVSAQPTIEQISNAPALFQNNSQILDLYTFEGKVFAIYADQGDLRSNFATLDIEGQTLNYISEEDDIVTGGGGNRNTSRYTEVGGMLFAKAGEEPYRKQRLLRVTESQVVPLTPIGVDVLTDPIEMGGTIYFLAFTEYLPPTYDNDRYKLLRRMTLYSTDGTAQGTARVVDLPLPAEYARPGVTASSKNWLVAGEEALLIAASDFRNGLTALHQYSPGNGLIQVGVEDGQDITEQPTFNPFQGLGNIEYDRGPALSAVYADGHFYLFEAILSNNLFRVAENDEKIQPISDNSGTIANLPWNATATMLATDAGRVIYYVYNPQTAGAFIGSIATGSQGTTSLEELVSWSSTVDATPTVEGDTLYYSRNGMVWWRDLVSDRENVVFFLDGGNFGPHRLAHTSTDLYLIPLDFYGRILYRYNYAKNITYQRNTNDLLGNYYILDSAIIVNDRHNGGSRQLTYLPTGTLDGQTFSPDGEPSYGGVLSVATTSTGEFLYTFQDRDLDVNYRLYDPNTNATKDFNPYVPGVTTEEIRLAFRPNLPTLLIDRPTDSTFQFYTVADGQLEPIDRAGGDQPFVMPGRGRLVLGKHAYLITFAPSGERKLIRYNLGENAGSEETLIDDLEEYRYEFDFWRRLLTITDERSDGTRHIVVDDETGELLSDRVLPDDHRLNLAVNRQGSWWARFNEATNESMLAYYPHDGAAATFVPLTDANAWLGQLSAHAVGDQLFATLPSMTESQLWVVDGATGEVSQLSGPDLSSVWYPAIVQSKTHLIYGDEENSLGYTDGTTQGTGEVKREGVALPAAIRSFREFHPDSTYYFGATGPSGDELYAYYPGTNPNVELVADLNPGPGSSSPGVVLRTDDGLYVTGIRSADQVRQLLFISDLPTATPHLQTVVRLSLYPNPTTERARVEVTEQHQLRQIEVMDNLGRRVLRQAGSGQRAELDVSRLPAGTYHIISHFVDGGRGYGKLSVAR